MTIDELTPVVEALLLSSESALSVDQIIASFEDKQRPDKKQVRDALHALDEQLTGRAVELREVANGWRVQVRQDYSPYIGRLWEERPPRYSRALLETLALIVYRQPISRGEIEEIRGVSLSPNIIKTLMEREWVKVVGVREAPGRPELLGTTKTFLDDFNLKSLNQLPSLPELRDPDALGEALARLGIEPEPPEPEPEPEEAEQADLLHHEAIDGESDASDAGAVDEDFEDLEETFEITDEEQDPTGQEAEAADITTGQVADLNEQSDEADEEGSVEIAHTAQG